MANKKIQLQDNDKNNLMPKTEAANVSGLGTLATKDNVSATDINTGSATSGNILSADGSGGATWVAPPYTTNGTEVTLNDGLTVDTDGDVEVGKNLTVDGNVDIHSSIDVTGILTTSNEVDLIGSGFSQFKDASHNTLKMDSSQISSGSATSGQFLVANGSGGVSWQSPSGVTDIYQHQIYYNAIVTGSSFKTGNFYLILNTPANIDLSTPTKLYNYLMDIKGSGSNPPLVDFKGVYYRTSDSTPVTNVFLFAREISGVAYFDIQGQFDTSFGGNSFTVSSYNTSYWTDNAVKII